MDVVQPDASERQRLNSHHQPMKTKGRGTRLANHTSGFYFSMEFPSFQQDIHTIHPSTFPRRIPPQIQHDQQQHCTHDDNCNDRYSSSSGPVPLPISSGSVAREQPLSLASPPRSVTIQDPSRSKSCGNEVPLQNNSCSLNSSDPSSDSQGSEVVLVQSQHQRQQQQSPQSVAESLPSQSQKDADPVKGIVSVNRTVRVNHPSNINPSNSPVNHNSNNKSTGDNNSPNIVPQAPSHPQQQVKVEVPSSVPSPSRTISMHVDTTAIHTNIKNSNSHRSNPVNHATHGSDSKNSTTNSSSGYTYPLQRQQQIRSSPSSLQYNMAYMPRKVKVERVYDMNLVPKVKKSSKFLEKWRRRSEAEQKSLVNGLVGGLNDDINVDHHPEPIHLENNSAFSCPTSGNLPSLVPCDASASEHSEEGEGSSCEASESSASHCDIKSTASSASECSSVKGTCTNTASALHKPCHFCLHPSDLCPEDDISTALEPPFASDCESVIWVPKNRSDWEDCIDEMVAVCTAAEWHRYKAKARITKKKQGDFHPPISRIYIRDRIDIDDPLRGYQIRHKTGGWLQGFVMMTTFTTWTHYFKWDSAHSVNGIDQSNRKGKVDDCTLSDELERQTRSGNPLTEGVVWPTIAEMSLVGALGCGEYLLQMALDDISRRGTYDYVVLEATESARPFYEKFGFIRVGAVCKYGNEKDVVSENGEVQIVGYRHWTYANESEQRVDAHGAPSCMMARRIKRRSPESLGPNCLNCRKRTKPSFVDELAKYFVCEKPKIEPLNSNPSGRKRSMSGSSVTVERLAKKVKTVKQKRISTSTSSGRTSRTPSRLDEYDKSTKSRSRSNSNAVTSFRQRNSSISATGRTSINSSSSSSRAQASVTNATTSTLSPPRVKKETIGSTSNKTIPLRKQRIPTMYRSPKKQYYYNKVVVAKKGESTAGHTSKYYFVIHYDADTLHLRLIPLFLKGKFKGKREGRPKWKADVLERGNEDEKTYLKSMNVLFTNCSKWDIVQSYAVTKCASVKQESWDILC
eukprot:CAMPEP_0204616458 /NCGR_PEP_ID=MMETSP0717-20131115/3690_1 /ASSEMBLY_ACC=CAM_ASM_000666 /TAXON_ID=230516 /ORGANISM="Chaetoceros curvisetus" /LENGTH=1023 /DNA_ID=CAMNT_0051629709 /DNA_START=589 /DNA_END=3660 /DNA_ORIENTATION=+